MAVIPMNRKIIFILLGLVLVSGAIVAAMAINGGNWLISNPAFGQAPKESLAQDAIVPVTGSGVEIKSAQNQSSGSEFGCHHDTAMNPADW